MTFVTPIIVVLLGLVIGFLTNLNSDKERIIDVIDESGYAKEIFQEEKDAKTKFNILEGKQLTDVIADVKGSDKYGVLFIPKSDSITQLSNKIQFFSEDTPSLTIMKNMERKIEKKLTDINFERKGINITEVDAARIDITIDQESFAGEKSSEEGGVVKLIFGMLLGYLLFMFIIIYGNMIMRSVIEEKTNRIIEVIISSVKPIQLMLGKIFGTSLAAITQFSIWVVLGAVLSLVILPLLGLESNQAQQQEMIKEVMETSDFQQAIMPYLTEFFNLPLLNLIGMFVLFFIGGFLMYSSLYAAIGAAVDSETDTQQFMMPIIIPLMLAVYIGIFTMIEDPHGTVAQVFSYIPLTSPVVMMMRIPFGVPLWQQFISVALLFITFRGVVWFAAKVYRVGILMYGKKPSYKEIFKWLKY